MKDRVTKVMNEHPKHWGSFITRDIGIMTELAPLIEKYSITVQAAAYCYINEVTPVCSQGNVRKFTWFKKGFEYCGTRNACHCHKSESVAKARATNLAKYGEISYAKTQEYQVKSKATNIRKFGVEQASMSDEVRARAKQTCIDRYGTEYPIQLDEFKSKLAKTKLDRHGSAGYNNRDLRAATLQERYAVSNPTYLGMSTATLDILKDERTFTQFIAGKSRQFAAKELSVDPNTINKYAEIYGCTDLFMVSGSKWEEEIVQLLNLLGVKYVRNARSIITPYELDFYLPSVNAAIEVNGNYWHAESKKGKDYHAMKWAKCQEQNIDLYQYFEDEFENKWNIIASKIKYVCKMHTTIVGAREVTIGNISYGDEAKFLTDNHIQGPSTSRNNSLAAFHNGKVVGVISWLRRPQYLEITRFATAIELHLPGLFSKMLKRVISLLAYSGKIVSFSNNGHSNGGMYRAAGFVHAATLPPTYWYMKGYSVRENRQQYMKSKIAKKFNVDITGKTEKQLMDELGFTRIWDSGKLRWELII